MTTGRLEAFSDGVFAIAITLLVLDIHVPSPGDSSGGPTLAQALLRQWPVYLAYVTSFLTILIMWVNHHAILARIKQTDHVLLFLNGLLLMSISVVPFPTSLVAGYLERPDRQLAAAIYSGTFVAVAVLFNLVRRYAATGTACSIRTPTHALSSDCHVSISPARPSPWWPSCSPSSTSGPASAFAPCWPSSSPCRCRARRGEVRRSSLPIGAES